MAGKDDASAQAKILSLQNSMQRVSQMYQKAEAELSELQFDNEALNMSLTMGQKTKEILEERIEKQRLKIKKLEEANSKMHQERLNL